MLSRAQEWERRSRQHAETLGKAVVMLDDVTALEYRVENLSAGGALLGGGPLLPLWKSYRLVLRLDGAPPLELRARTVWQTEEVPPRLGVSFEHVDVSVQDLIDEAVVRLLSGVHSDVAPASRVKLASWLP